MPTPSYAATLTRPLSRQKLAGIANRNRVYSGDQAIVVGNCNYNGAGSAWAYAQFWRSDVMCVADWDEGWGMEQHQRGHLR